MSPRHASKAEGATDRIAGEQHADFPADAIFGDGAELILALGGIQHRRARRRDGRGGAVLCGQLERRRAGQFALTSPRLRAMAAAWARSRAPNFARIAFTCALTVPSVT